MFSSKNASSLGGTNITSHLQSSVATACLAVCSLLAGACGDGLPAEPEKILTTKDLPGYSWKSFDLAANLEFDFPGSVLIIKDPQGNLQLFDQATLAKQDIHQYFSQPGCVSFNGLALKLTKEDYLLTDYSAVYSIPDQSDFIIDEINKLALIPLSRCSTPACFQTEAVKIIDVEQLEAGREYPFACLVFNSFKISQDLERAAITRVSLFPKPLTEIFPDVPPSDSSTFDNFRMATVTGSARVIDPATQQVKIPVDHTKEIFAVSRQSLYPASHGSNGAAIFFLVDGQWYLAGMMHTLNLFKQGGEFHELIVIEPAAISNFFQHADAPVDSDLPNRKRNDSH